MVDFFTSDAAQAESRSFISWKTDASASPRDFSGPLLRSKKSRTSLRPGGRDRSDCGKYDPRYAGTLDTWGRNALPVAVDFAD